MGELLVPGDEREFTAFVCETFGAKLLLSDVTTDGEPQIANDPLAALPQMLPGPAKFGVHQVLCLMFWLPAFGPVRTLAAFLTAYRTLRRACELVEEWAGALAPREVLLASPRASCAGVQGAWAQVFDAAGVGPHSHLWDDAAETSQLRNLFGTPQSK